MDKRRRRSRSAGLIPLIPLIVSSGRDEGDRPDSHSFDDNNYIPISFDIDNRWLKPKPIYLGSLQRRLSAVNNFVSRAGPQRWSRDATQHKHSSSGNKPVVLLLAHNSTDPSNFAKIKFEPTQTKTNKQASNRAISLKSFHSLKRMSVMVILSSLCCVTWYSLLFLRYISAERAS